MKIIFFSILLLSVEALFSQNISLSEPFKNCHINGSITIYDYNEHEWISSDINDSHFATLPASTFKIMNTLIALEKGVVQDENEIIKWHGRKDTMKYGFRPEIYHDMGMKEAFIQSAVWVYIELAKKIGKEKYHKFLVQSHYGNDDLSVDGDDFWNFGNFAVSPVNQIEMLIGVYEETLPFSKRSFKILKEMMVQHRDSNYILRAKTGWARYGGKDIGWWVGYIETSGDVCFFATRLIKNREDFNPGFGNCRKEITMNILRQLKIIE